jgi:TPR repeat protein/class 3 adenylate cyclase
VYTDTNLVTADDMADLNKMDRTWLCSVVFMDITNYSSQSTELQMKWKQRFNGYLGEAIREVPESERVILDTGDGAAICFLGAPEAAMFAALQLCHCFVTDQREQAPGLGVRMGINLGPVKLVKDINGALNAIGDGLNAGQRIMTFAAPNQILVSQSYFEVVSRLSDDYKQLFQLKGTEADKHIREHTVYHLNAAGAEKRDHVVENAAGQAMPSAPVNAPIAAAVPPPAPRPASTLWLAVGAVALVVLAAANIWYFYGSPRRALSNTKTIPTISQPTPAPPQPTSVPDKSTLPVPAAETSAAKPLAIAPVVPKVAKPKASAPPEDKPAPPPPLPAAPAPDPAALLQDGKDQVADDNAEAARESFRKAAEAGNAQAAVLLGTLYARGDGGPKSDPDAVRMFRRAADLGNARGMYNLGQMCEAGRVTPGGPDYRAAAGWYLKAANLGDHDAAFRLGLLYEQGNGVPKDLNQARRLFTQAGTPDATMRLSKLPPQ